MRERRFTLHDHCLKQLGIEAAKGSIEVGKDADFPVFDHDLLMQNERNEGNERTRQYF